MQKERAFPNEMYGKQTREAHNQITLRLTLEEVKGLKDYIRMSGKPMTLEMAVKNILKEILRD